ncbi:MAG: hypothetical protein AUK48_04700 [Oscillatoriales cyanobacterium CG2_30_44_21]|nr:MAG: hypothetical protein AUK48_04700 [Oscillatoriales cyanobacterium CG2_30_44_21]
MLPVKGLILRFDNLTTQAIYFPQKSLSTYGDRHFFEMINFRQTRLTHQQLIFELINLLQPIEVLSSTKNHCASQRSRDAQ